MVLHTRELDTRFPTSKGLETFFCWVFFPHPGFSCRCFPSLVERRELCRCRSRSAKPAAVCCRPDTNLAAAVELLWVNNCGMLPVVGNNGKLEAVITDRDICIAIGTRNRLPSELTVQEVATKNAITCKPDDEIHEALHTMARKQVRRLPVVDHAGVPQGILSMDDIITHGDMGKWQGCCELSSEEIIRALKRLYGQQASGHERTHAAQA
jgi:CBS domain-containing protein